MLDTYGTNVTSEVSDLPPQKRRGRRPHLSIAYSPGIVDGTFTAEVIIEMTKGFVIPVFL